MEKLESLLTRLLWREIGGTLYEDFPLTNRGKINAPAVINGLIDVKGKNEIGKYSPRSLNKKTVAVVLAKPKGAGMFSVGEILSAVKLLDNRHELKSIEGYIVSVKEDEVLRSLLMGDYPFLKLKVYEVDKLRKRKEQESP
jgi:hypothetical protein